MGGAGALRNLAEQLPLCLCVYTSVCVCALHVCVPNSEAEPRRQREVERETPYSPMVWL